jgi:hypothetical protein
VLHRAASAKAALEAMKMLQAGGGVIQKIVVTRTGREVTVEELRLLAKDER